MAEQRAHLSDLFRSGEDVVVNDGDGNEFPIYVMRPSGLQQEEAREHANAKVARYKIQVRDIESDAYLTVRFAIDDSDYDEAVDTLVRFDEPEIREASLQHMMYNEDSEWKDDKYMATLQAMHDRVQDIDKYNEQMEEAGTEDRIDPDTDPQLQDIMAEYNRFQEAVEETVEGELEKRREQVRAMSDRDMRDELIQKTFDLDTKMQWYEAYQLRMLGYACRYPEDHKKMYFDSLEDVHELPVYIRTQLFEAYERVERGSDDVKNSLSLLSS